MIRSKPPRDRSLGALGIALAGLVLSGSAFAVQPLAQAYLVPAGHAAPEGKCGEGKCGDDHFDQVDTDHDGRVSRAEFVTADPDRIAEFAGRDVDGDGYLVKRESYESIKAVYEANGKSLPAGRFKEMHK